MDRRRFLLTSLAIFAAPHNIEAQRAGRLWRVGILAAGSASARDDAFRQALRDLGYIDGQSVAFEARYADGKIERLPRLAAELVHLNVDVILASPTETIRAAQQATKTIPIVMAFSADPVTTGLVSSLASPGGNTTGLTSVATELNAKRLELLKTTIPDASTVCFLVNRVTQNRMIENIAVSGRALGLRISIVTVEQPGDLDRVLAAVAKAHHGGMLVDSGVFAEQRRHITEFAVRSRLPTIAGTTDFAEAGALMSYGPDYHAMFRQAALYVDKIFKGARPRDLPVEQPSKFELVVNLKTAKALGLTIPPSLLLRADRVIE
jgi:putative tryptophan/tyrosine transport system substrate-binding protein